MTKWSRKTGLRVALRGMDLVTEYLSLGLRFDRVVDGYVDAYIGPPELREQVAAEPRAGPRPARRAGGRAVRGGRRTPAGAQRADFLRAHLDALAVGGRRLAGEEMSFADEVEAYFQVRIAPVDTDVYAAVHDEMAELLGGTGPVEQRWAASAPTTGCPAPRWRPAVRRLAAALRERVGRLPVLPEPEHIEFEIAQDAAWSGFNYYLGGYRSRVAVNAGIGHRVSQLPLLTAHECYPGHHTEHCRKEALLIAERGELEQTIFLVNTPAVPDGRGPRRSRAERGGRPRLGRLGGGRAARRRPGVRAGAGRAARGRDASAEHGPAERRPDAARRSRRRRRGARLPAALAARRRAARPADAALPVRPAVAGLHLHLRRGGAAAPALAEVAPGRADRDAAVPAAARRAPHPGRDPGGTRGRCGDAPTDRACLRPAGSPRGPRIALLIRFPSPPNPPHVVV